MWGACMRVNWKRAVLTCARRKSSQCYHPECLVRATGSRASSKMEKTAFYSLCAWQAAGSLLPCGRADHARFGSLCFSLLGRAAGPVFVLESLCNSGWPVTHVNPLVSTSQILWLQTQGSTSGYTEFETARGKNAALMNMQAPSVSEFKCQWWGNMLGAFNHIHQSLV